MNGKERLRVRMLRQPLLQGIDQGVALHHDLIFNAEYLLALTALLAFQLLNILLDLMLLFKSNGLTGLSA